MNEIIFIAHGLLVAAFCFFSLRFGRAGITAFICISSILANFFVIKQIDLFGLAVTASDIFSIGAILGLNLLQEFYGKDRADQAVNLSFWALIFFYLMSTMHLFYRPNSFDFSHEAFAAVFSHKFRVIFSSIAVAFVSQKLDVASFAYFKRFFKEGFLARFVSSAMISQLFDTLLFSFAALYGLAPMWSIISFSYLVKVISIALSIVAIKILKPRLRQSYEI